MSLKRPSAVVTIDGRELNAAEAALVSLKVELASVGAHDSATLDLWPDSKFANASAGATLAVALGDKDAEVDVLMGEVGAVRSTPRGVRVEGVSATIALSHTFTSQTYLDQSASDIVNDLASAVSIDQVDAPMKLAAYHADNGRSVWTHLQMLARLTGSHLGSSADGSLRFVPADGAASPTRLRYGADLLDWDFAQVSAASPPTVAAHGAGSEAGAAKWHWLRHNPGGGNPVRIVGAIATKDAADLASKAIEGRATRAAVRGRLLIVGNASIRPGDSVELADLPGADPGSLLVVGCRHTLDSIGGFVTTLTVEAGSGGGLPL
jgi:prophage tail gpP-like protein